MRQKKGGVCLPASYGFRRRFIKADVSARTEIRRPHRFVFPNEIEGVSTGQAPTRYDYHDHWNSPATSHPPGCVPTYQGLTCIRTRLLDGLDSDTSCGHRISHVQDDPTPIEVDTLNPVHSVPAVVVPRRTIPSSPNRWGFSTRWGYCRRSLTTTMLWLTEFFAHKRPSANPPYAPRTRNPGRGRVRGRPVQWRGRPDGDGVTPRDVTAIPPKYRSNGPPSILRSRQGSVSERCEAPGREHRTVEGERSCFLDNRLDVSAERPGAAVEDAVVESPARLPWTGEFSSPRSKTASAASTAESRRDAAHSWVAMFFRAVATLSGV